MFATWCCHSTFLKRHKFSKFIICVSLSHLCDMCFVEEKCSVKCNSLHNYPLVVQLLKVVCMKMYDAQRNYLQNS